MAWRPRIKDSLRRRLIGVAIRAIVGSRRVELGGQEPVEALRKAGVPLVFLFWHRHLFVLIHHFRDCAAVPLISLSRDGEIVAQVAADFGMRPVRGSSSTGGTRALLRLLRLLRERPAPVLITADGPRGPAERIKPGALLLAQKTGAAIVPVVWTGNRLYEFAHSWDRFLLPLPFGHLRILYGEPVFIPPSADEAALAEARHGLELRMAELAVRAAGSPPPP